MPVTFSVNQQPAQFDGPPDVPLLWVVREQLGLTGSKFGCGIGACGACTMHIDGVPARSCIVPIAAVEGRQVTTIEGLAPNADHPVQRAWRELDVPQCGYCQSGMIMTAAHLLKQNLSPSDRDIDAAMTNLCRCATYVRIRKAIHRASQMAKPDGVDRSPNRAQISAVAGSQSWRSMTRPQAALPIAAPPRRCSRRFSSLG